MRNALRSKSLKITKNALAVGTCVKRHIECRVMKQIAGHNELMCVKSIRGCGKTTNSAMPHRRSTSIQKVLRKHCTAFMVVDRRYILVGGLQK